MTKPVDISAEYLLPISASNFGLKERNLIETYITPFPHLDVLMMGDISSS
jgi:hypothetical protein